MSSIVGAWISIEVVSLHNVLSKVKIFYKLYDTKFIDYIEYSKVTYMEEEIEYQPLQRSIKIFREACKQSSALTNLSPDNWMRYKLMFPYPYHKHKESSALT